jgi:hypothetical protein
MALEKLIRLQRDLLELLNNFVSFSASIAAKARPSRPVPCSWTAAAAI